MREIKEVPLSVVWQMRHEIMYPDEAFEVVKLDSDPKGIHLGLYDDDKLVSVISLFLESGRLQFRKFCTKRREQGKGYGSYLLKHVFETFAPQYQAKAIWCNARTTAVAIYEKFGMQKTPHAYQKFGFDFVIMEKAL
ncbi:GNAT family N-acetyltransferase [Reichenbachiella ulvae]|uniref:GNAT family N-acetyltransferase n=1 Tax=Reichenbachiella ulvae TaxID=2980104 RepID=A0ABT3CZ41_9BACT|nr:GNAT family N-acetyltransferase [Reichenbachiella ulvae]MCV9388897.1 GNAT family N-acetyltransferase [Reichenbachiella ulvae]